MPTVVPEQTALDKGDLDAIEASVEKREISYSIPPLGQPRDEKKFWFQRGENYDPHAIATQV